jgi:hypothetical protein
MQGSGEGEVAKGIGIEKWLYRRSEPWQSCASWRKVTTRFGLIWLTVLALPALALLAYHIIRLYRRSKARQAHSICSSCQIARRF